MTLTLGITQMKCSWDIDANIAKAEALVRFDDHALRRAHDALTAHRPYGA